MINRPQILVRPRTDIESGRVHGGRLISIAGHNGPYPQIQRDHWAEILDLRFDDVAMAVWESKNQVWRGPTLGIALAILAYLHGPGGEMDAVEQLLTSVLDPNIVQPNPLLVSYADLVLDRNGAIEEALLSRCPRYVSWLAYWRQHGARLP
jgi:hypothetical protein